MKKLIVLVIQIFALFAASQIGNWIVMQLHLKIPGSIVGIILVFLLLQSGIFRVQWFEAGANWLLSEMLLFFIPSAVGIIQYPDLLKADGVKLLSIILASTITVMGCTGYLAERLIRNRKEASRT